MHRLLVETDLLEQASPALPKDALRHLKVLRLRVGEPVELFDGRGAARRFIRAESADAAAPLAADGPVVCAAASPRRLTLFACVTKGSRWDWTIEKATELGVGRIVPVISGRTVVRLARGERAAKRERWQRIAEDAARQSDALWLPEICETVDFADALPLVRGTTCFVGALADPPPPPLLTAVAESLSAGTPKELAAFVGPEGDFTPEELSALAAIAVPASFGPTVLRAETAAVFVVSVLAAVAASNT